MNMRVVNAKSLVTFAAVVLVVPFAAAAALIGAGAVGGAESAEHNMLLMLLAAAGALYGATKGFEPAGECGAANALPFTARERRGLA